MANVDNDLIDEIIKLTHGEYEDVIRIKDCKQAIVSEQDIKYMLCDLIDCINDLQYDYDELKKEMDELRESDDEKWEKHLGDIADEEYERYKLGL